MGIEGCIRIDLHRDGDDVGDVAIHSSRPLHAARLLVGKTPDEALDTLRLLYNVCGTAQACAAAAALERAMGIATPETVQTAREMLVWMETAREHLWRILVDWRALLGDGQDAAQLSPTRNLLKSFRQALVGGDVLRLVTMPQPDSVQLEQQIAALDTLLRDTVYDCDAAQWLATNEEAHLLAWAGAGTGVAARLLTQIVATGWEEVGRTEAAFIPELTNQALHARLVAPDAEAFIAAPDWQGTRCETTPLARQRHAPLIRGLLSAHGNGLLTRLAARLVELATIPQRLRQGMEGLTATEGFADAAYVDGMGIGEVEAARGRLVHRVELDRGRIRRYQILAPTEWNFHPHGVAAGALRSLRAANESTLRQQTALLVNAIDPCVAYELRVF